MDILIRIQFVKAGRQIKKFMQYVVAFGNFGAASSISFHIPAAQGQIFFQAKESIGVGVRGL